MDDVVARARRHGILAGMVLRLASDLPLLWRTPSSVQFGSAEPVVVLDEVTEGEDRLLATLAAGVSETGYAMLARSLGVEAERADRLLAAVGPALVVEPDPAAAGAAVLGDSPLARAVAGLLSSRSVLRSPEDAALVLLVADWVIAPADHTRWLNRDVPHLPVVVEERTVTVGPLVDPGAGPCLHCVHLTRVDADPAWTAVATQLFGRPGRVLAALELAEAAAFVARRVLERLSLERRGGAGGAGDAAPSWRLDTAGGVTARTWARHPDCRCAVPPGTDWAAAPDRAGHDVPSSASTVGAPA